jgi:hypothetical protein
MFTTAGETRSIIGARLGNASTGDCAIAMPQVDQAMSETAVVNPAWRTKAAFLAGFIEHPTQA